MRLLVHVFWGNGASSGLGRGLEGSESRLGPRRLLKESGLLSPQSRGQGAKAELRRPWLDPLTSGPPGQLGQPQGDPYWDWAGPLAIACLSIPVGPPSPTELGAEAPPPPQTTLPALAPRSEASFRPGDPETIRPGPLALGTGLGKGDPIVTGDLRFWGLENWGSS